VLGLGGTRRFCSPGLFPYLESYLFSADSNRASTSGQPIDAMVQRWLIGSDCEHLSEHLDSLPTPELAVLQLVKLGKRIAASDWVLPVRNGS
jgi:hypothetical protein